MTNAKNIITQIANDVSETWTANDGGLTWAASDVLGTCSRCLSLINAGNKAEALRWAGKREDWVTVLNHERDAVFALIDWAEDK